MTTCANHDCPSRRLSKATMAHHRVQIEELQFQQMGDGPDRTVGAVQRPFAAVACSKRCAVAVLTAAVDAEDAARSKHASDDPFDKVFD